VIKSNNLHLAGGEIEIRMGQLDSMGIHCNICTSFIHAAQEEGRD